MLAIGSKDPAGCIVRAVCYPYRWGLDDGDSLDNLLLVGLGSWTVKITDDGSHTSLVAHGGSKVDWLLWVILWEAV